MIRYSWTILDYSPAYNQHYADHILEIQQRGNESEEWLTIHTEFFTHDWDDPTTPLSDMFLQHAAYQAIRQLGLDFHECVEGVERHVFDRGDYEPIPVELPEDRISASPFGEPPY